MHLHYASLVLGVPLGLGRSLQDLGDLLLEVGCSAEGVVVAGLAATLKDVHVRILR